MASRPPRPRRETFSERYARTLANAIADEVILRLEERGVIPRSPRAADDDAKIFGQPWSRFASREEMERDIDEMLGIARLKRRPPKR